MVIGKAKALRQGIDGSKCTSCGTILDPSKLRRFEYELASTQTLIDDLTETAGTLTSAAAVLKEHGAKKIYAAVSHAVLVDLAIPRLPLSS